LYQARTDKAVLIEINVVSGRMDQFYVSLRRRTWLHEQDGLAQ